MNAAPLLQPGRREHPRARIAATVLAFTSSRVFGQYIVEDLSVGGVRVVGEAASLRFGQRVTLLFDLPGGGPITCRAEVVRLEARDGGSQAVALAFVNAERTVRTLVGNVVVRDLLSDVGFGSNDHDEPAGWRRGPHRAGTT
jgi:hypothetical protein